MVAAVVVEQLIVQVAVQVLAAQVELAVAVVALVKLEQMELSI